MIAVVKANAYGHGSAKVAQTLQNLGVHYFGVSLIEEGIALRDNGITKNIIIMGGLYPQSLPYITPYRFIVTIDSPDTAIMVNEYFKK
mgnify:FL=1